MKVYIVHDRSGEIGSVARVEQEPGPSDMPYVPVLPNEGETVTEISAEGVAVELSPLEIHENYRLDVERGVLVRKDEG